MKKQKTDTFDAAKKRAIMYSGRTSKSRGSGCGVSIRRYAAKCKCFLLSAGCREPPFLLTSTVPYTQDYTSLGEFLLPQTAERADCLQSRLCTHRAGRRDCWVVAKVAISFAGCQQHFHLYLQSLVTTLLEL